MLVPVEDQVVLERSLRGGGPSGYQPTSSTETQQPQKIIGRHGFLEKEHAENGDLSCWKCGLVVTEEECEVDHIVPLANGGSLDQENFQLLCLACHREKTRKENQARRPHP